jgi:hypothetical protein
MSTGIFITVKDIMRLSGSDCYQACWRRHKTIRELFGKGKKKLTIREYCLSEDISVEEVAQALGRGNG